MAGQEKKLVINKEFNPLIIEIILKRNWQTPIYITLLFLAIAFVYLRYTKPIFESTAVLQIVEEDKVSQVLGDVTKTTQGANLALEVEFLNSDFLMNQTIKRLNLNVNLFSEGKLLTKDLYKQSSFEVLPISLNDSSLCGSRIDITLIGGKICLLYKKDGLDTKAFGLPNHQIKNADFNVIIKVPYFSEFKEACTENKLYFQFNNQNRLLSDVKSNLVVMTLDPNAKTIQMTYDHHNPKMCRDVLSSLIDCYFDYQEISKKNNGNNTIDFINQQLDSLSEVLKNSKN